MIDIVIYITTGRLQRTHQDKDTGRYDAYYDFVKEYVFDGKEFGPAAGMTSDCSVPDGDAETPMPGAADGSWLEGLSGE